VTSMPGSCAVNWRGIHVVDIQQARNFNLGNIDRGVVIVKIDPGSPASETTLAAGDVIIEIDIPNAITIKNINDFKNVVEKYKNSKKPILIYRMRRSSDGRITKGYVAVKSE